ncbi:MAG: urease accessory protein UreE [Cellulosilyticum sp.]|nr:urease accessory protein UreE [Cellulosilyticum sp.]
MICEKILGNLKDEQYSNKNVEYVDIDWHDAFHKIHKKTTKEGTEVGIRLDNDVLVHGLKEGDVLYADSDKVIAVHILPCEAIVAQVDAHHPHMIAKLCYEIGNRHATLFWGNDDHTFITPYTEPMLVMIQKLHGVTATVKTLSLDFNKAISASINAHTHG